MVECHWEIVNWKQEKRNWRVRNWTLKQFQSYKQVLRLGKGDLRDILNEIKSQALLHFTFKRIKEIEEVS
jgi:hypothetical protein